MIDFTPPPPKPRTPWKPEPEPPRPRHIPYERFKASLTPTPKPPKPKRVPPPDPRLLPEGQPVAATITTASDGAWQVTFRDLNLMAQHQTMPAFVVSTLPSLSRPLPTSVVYRVWGMLERGELTLEEP